MELQLECLSCILRQAMDAAKMATSDEVLQKKIMDEALAVLAGYRNYVNSPALTRAVQSVVIKNTGVSDPYAGVKKDDIEVAARILPALREFLDKAENKLYWALKIVATGNVIDRAVTIAGGFEAIMDSEIRKKFAIDDFAVFEQKLTAAQNILIIGDNAGESVFDRILIEHLPSLHFTYAVRSGPALNDVTEQDAIASGLGECADIISTGCDSPGVLLDEFSQEFLDIFWGADIVISKGQGNFEALSGSGRGIFFLLKAKCTTISAAFNTGLNEYVFQCQE